MNGNTPSMQLTDHEFNRIREIASADAGLAIPASKKSLVQSRIARRMRQLQVSDCSTYLASLTKDHSERSQLISALTTNVSHFFREGHHFEFLKKNYLENYDGRPLRIWSAGCSSGQEPYSIAMTILNSIPSAAENDIVVLATDIDEAILKKAVTGSYLRAELENVDAPNREKHFTASADGDSFQVKDELKQLIRFKKLNLNASEWPMKKTFDVIMCRNVVIYFDDETQSRLWPKFRSLLKPGGTLMLGHSERVNSEATSGFQTVGVTTYRKV
ncbi:MAG: protein-glutamate O-methyltransferase CheR [Paracoccaceae bacterium]|nr:protein-glutamate O-methyltransferase CheR [Paracoccaceae bacterium]